MKRVVVTVATVAMLIVAGCNGSPGGTSGSVSATATEEATVSADETTTVEPDSSTTSTLYPPGVNESAGVYNRTALIRAHLRAIRGGAVEETRFVRDGFSRRIRITRARNATTAVTTNGRATWWRSGSTVARRNASKSPPVAVGTGWTELAIRYRLVTTIGHFPYLYVNRTALAVNGTTTIDGQRVLRLSVDGLDRTPQQEQNLLRAFRNASGSILVTGDGVVRRLNISAGPGATEQLRRITYSTRQEGNVTASRPGWVPDPLTASVTRTADNRVLAVTLRGTRSVPAGTRVEATGPYLSWGNFTLDRSVDPGETLYVYITGTRNVTGQVGRQPTPPENTLRLSNGLSISVAFELGGVEFQFAPPIGKYRQSDW